MASCEINALASNMPFNLAADDSPRANASPRRRSRQKQRTSLSSWWDASSECEVTPSLPCDEVDVVYIGSADSPCPSARCQPRGRVSLSHWWQTPGEEETLDITSSSPGDTCSERPVPPSNSTKADDQDAGPLESEGHTMVLRVASPTRRRSLAHVPTT